MEVNDHFCFYLVRGHRVYPFRKEQHGFLGLRRREITENIFEGMVVLKWERKGEKGNSGLCSRERRACL